MNISLAYGKYVPRRRTRGDLRRDEEGLAVITVMIVLAIVLIYLAGNIRMLYSLERELKLVEKQQTHRLQAAAPASISLINTNRLPAQTNATSK